MKCFWFTYTLNEVTFMAVPFLSPLVVILIVVEINYGQMLIHFYYYKTVSLSQYRHDNVVLSYLML
jgi:hypothetical protein